MRLCWSLAAVAGVVPALMPHAAAAEPPPSGTRVVRAEAVSVARPGHCENPQWSRDGQALAYERVFLQDRKIELNVMSGVFGARKERKIELASPEGRDRAASRAVARFKKTAPVRRGDVCRELAWGPSSEPDVFAYACNVEGGVYQLFWNEGTPLTKGRGGAGQPALSPVGWRMAFISSRRGVEGLALIDDLMEGSQPRPLVPAEGRIDRQPVWGPKGRALAFVGHADNSADLYLIRDVRRATETLVRLTDWPDDEVNPSWSPAGDRIAFFSNRGKARGRRTGYDLYVVDVSPTGKPYRVATDVVPHEKRGPAWTPDGRHIVFVKNLQAKKVVDPLRAVPVRKNATELPLPTGTVSNQDPSITVSGGRWWLAYTSLGYFNAKKLAWRRVFLYSLAALQGGASKKD